LQYHTEIPAVPDRIGTDGLRNTPESRQNRFDWPDDFGRPEMRLRLKYEFPTLQTMHAYEVRPRTKQTRRSGIEMNTGAKGVALEPSWFAA
jgi:hypothetical protein